MADTELVFSHLYRAVLDGDDLSAGPLATRALADGVPAIELVERALVPAIREAGRLWEEGEYFLPELITAAQAMKAAMAVLHPVLGAGASVFSAGRVVLGTVEGDIHDIGKALLGTMLTANGFEVSDEGVSVPVARFIERARAVDADIICASTLLATTMVRQRELVAAVRAAGLRARVMVGGAPVSQQWADTIGADGYADTAMSAVGVARGLVGHRDVG